MEERVTVHDALDAPERDAEPDPCERDESSAPPPPRLPPPRERQRDGAHEQNEREREVERRVHREREGERRRNERTRPGERARGSGPSECTRKQPPREQEDECRRREPEPQTDPGVGQEPCDAEQRHGQEQPRDAHGYVHASNSGTVPEPSHSAVSRYIRPRSPRKRRPRSRSETRKSSRARSAYAVPRCFARKRR